MGVTEQCMHILSEWYTFKHRGSIFLKGKNNLETYYLEDRKPAATMQAVS